MATQRVYVNLPAHKDGELIVARATKRTSGAGARSSRWALERDTDNLGTGPTSPDEWFTKKGLVEESASAEARAREFENRVVLPLFGGEVYRLTVSKVHDSKDGAGRRLEPVRLEAWRRLYFTLSYMKEYASTASDVERALGGLFSSAFIELKRESPDGADSAQISSVDRVDSDQLKTLVQSLPDVLYGRRAPSEGDQAGRWVRIALVKRCLGSTEQNVLQVVKSNATQEGGQWTLQKEVPPSYIFGADLTKVALSLERKAPPAPKDLVFPADGNVADVARATVSADGKTITVKVLDAGWNAELTALFATDNPPKGQVLNLRTYPSKELVGISEGNGNITIAVEDLIDRFGQDKAVAAIARAVAHEIIHSIGGVEPADAATSTQHPNFYGPTNGGVATNARAHCHFGISDTTESLELKTSSDAERKKTYEPGKPLVYVPGAKARICIMYHRAYVPHFGSAALCPDCVTQLRLRDLKEPLKSVY